MNGRQENDRITEKKITQGMEMYPKIIKDYYYSMTDKTAQTKKRYMMYIEQFMDYLAEHGKNPSNISMYKKMKPSDINEYLDYIRYRKVNGKIVENGDSIRAAKYYAISNFFDFLVNEEYIDNNPCSRVKPPKDRKQHEVVKMTADEVSEVKEKILDGYGSHKQQMFNEKWKYRNLAIITLGCQTGLRATALSEINMEDINFEELCITVTEKGNITRPCYISQKTAEVLKKWIKDRENLMVGFDDCNALFISNRRVRIAPCSIGLMLKNVTSDLDKNITPHKMRSTCATTLYSETHDIYLVSEVLGHKNISNTKRYTESSKEDKRRAADILGDVL